MYHGQKNIQIPTYAQKKTKKVFLKFGNLNQLHYLCTRFRCYSSVVERILGKDEVPSSTLGSSSGTKAEITLDRLSPLSFYPNKSSRNTTSYAPRVS